MIFCSRNIKQGDKQHPPYLYPCWMMQMRHHWQTHHLTYLYVCWIMQMRHHWQISKWNELLLILGWSRNRYASMVTESRRSYCGAHPAWIILQRIKLAATDICLASYCGATFGGVYDVITWHNSHILKSWISQERKEIFEIVNSVFLRLTVYLCMSFKMA